MTASKMTTIKNTNLNQSPVLLALRSGAFEEAMALLEREHLDDQRVITNALVQATYLLWVKTARHINTSVRKKETKQLKCIIKELLEQHNANPNSGLLTAFHHCMQIGEYDLMKLFIQNGVDPCESDSQGNIALHLACLHKCSPSIVEYLLTYGEHSYNAVNNMGECPLLCAVEKFCGSANHDFSNQLDNIMESIMMLLRCPNINVNLQDNDGRSVLFCIYEKLHTYNNTEYMQKLYKICTKLIEAGADVNVPNIKGQKPIHKALEHFWINEAMMLDFVNLLMCQSSIDVNASYYMDGMLCCPLTLLFNNFENISHQLVMQLLLDILKRGADVGPLLQMKDSQNRNIVHLVTLSQSSYRIDLLKEILKDMDKVPPSVINSKDSVGFTSISYIYATPIFPCGTTRGLDVNYSILYEMMKCGAHMKPFLIAPLLNKDNRCSRPISTILDSLHTARHLLLWLRAGLKPKSLHETIRHKIQHHFINLSRLIKDTQMKFVEYLAVDFMFKRHLRSPARFPTGYPTEIEETIQKIIDQKQPFPHSLQRQCATVLRFNLYPNAICGLEKMVYRNSKIPKRLKEIILASSVDDELGIHITELTEKEEDKMRLLQNLLQAQRQQNDF